MVERKNAVGKPYDDLLANQPTENKEIRNPNFFGDDYSSGVNEKEVIMKKEKEIDASDFITKDKHREEIENIRRQSEDATRKAINVNRRLSSHLYYTYASIYTLFIAFLFALNSIAAILMFIGIGDWLYSDTGNVAFHNLPVFKPYTSQSIYALIGLLTIYILIICLYYYGLKYIKKETEG
jgi:hypothetical protein